jgi:hypothetical protein
MPFENLLAPSSIKLFGRVVRDLKFNYDPNTTVIGNNNLLQRQLASSQYTQTILFTGTITQSTDDNGAPLTDDNRNPIYSNLITYSGLKPNEILTPNMKVKASYKDAGTKQVIEIFEEETVIWYVDPANNQFTVGKNPIDDNGGQPIQITATAPTDPTLARIYGFTFEGTYYGLPRPSIFLVHGGGNQIGNWADPSTLEQAGAMAREWDFSNPDRFNNPLVYWEYEKGDFSIRFDTEAGPFEQILLVAALRAGADMADRATPRSGASLAGASLAGASLSGASLSGASLSGASLSGASLSGASLRGR